MELPTIPYSPYLQLATYLASFWQGEIGVVDDGIGVIIKNTQTNEQLIFITEENNEIIIFCDENLPEQQIVHIICKYLECELN